MLIQNLKKYLMNMIEKIPNVCNLQVVIKHNCGSFCKLTPIFWNWFSFYWWPYQNVLSTDGLYFNKAATHSKFQMHFYSNNEMYSFFFPFSFLLSFSLSLFFFSWGLTGLIPFSCGKTMLWWKPHGYSKRMTIKEPD